GAEYAFRIKYRCVVVTTFEGKWRPHSAPIQTEGIQPLSVRRNLVKKEGLGSPPRNDDLVNHKLTRLIDGKGCNSRTRNLAEVEVVRKFSACVRTAHAEEDFTGARREFNVRIPIPRQYGKRHQSLVIVG